MVVRLVPRSNVSNAVASSREISNNCEETLADCHEPSRSTGESYLNQRFLCKQASLNKSLVYTI